jgi:EAL domain-containing protein (putative c-di-GMP-specific phosphodiesterase class I)/GGDEF domain-containing protein
MRNKYFSYKEAIKIALWYLGFGVLWIIFSDYLVYSVISNTQFAQNVKGVAFVFISALLIYMLVERRLKQIEVANSKLQESLEKLDIAYKELQLKEERLQESKNRYELALKGVEGIWDYDFKKDQLNMSSWLVRSLGLEQGNLFDSLDRILHPDDYDKFYSQINSYLSKEVDVYRSFFRVKDTEDNYIWVMNTGSAKWNSSGEVVRMVGVISDFDEYFNLREEVENLAYYNQETNLPNRHSAAALIKEKLQEKESCFSVIYIGLDDYIEIENAMGYEYLIERLSHLVDIMKEIKNDDYFLSYQEAFEFIVITNDDRVNSFVESLFNKLEEERVEKGISHYMSLSVGIANSINYKDPYDLVKDARVTMVEARKSYENSVLYYSEEISNIKAKEFSLEGDLRKAIEEDELFLEYQPFICLEKRKIIGFEALVRWNHPSRGVVYPDGFISLAEKKGFIKEIGKYVTNESVRQLREWHDKGYGYFTMAINISPLEIHQTDLASEFSKVLQKYDMPGEFISIEITEDVVIENIERANEVLTNLRNLGIKVSLDDFGIGYSSFRYLQEMPIDFMKIDRSFVIEMEYKKNKDFVKSAVSLGKNLNLEVIAEGIENEESCNFLKEIGCKLGQGYYFYKPKSAEAIEDILRKQP